MDAVKLLINTKNNKGKIDSFVPISLDEAKNRIKASRERAEITGLKAQIFDEAFVYDDLNLYFKSVGLLERILEDVNFSEKLYSRFGFGPQPMRSERSVTRKNAASFGSTRTASLQPA